MFTGIIEATGRVKSVEEQGTNRIIWIQSPISPELKTDQSVSHDGVCLTVEEVAGDRHRVTAIEETLSKTTIGNWKTGDAINLERCMIMNGRLDGHIVQGHVDGMGTCVERTTLSGSWEYKFTFPEEFNNLIVEKGSLTINGISLTAFEVGKDSFKVAIIPYTFEHTNIKSVAKTNKVNLEFDILGKYILRHTQLKQIALDH